jgi:hypothetical protein
MKKHLMICAALLALAGCAGAPKSDARPAEKNKAARPAAENAGREHMPASFLFDGKGCLKQDIKDGHTADIACLDPDKDGCVTRAEWDNVMGYWTTHTPEPGQSLCDRK